VHDSSENLNQFISLHQRTTNFEIPLNNRGVVLSEKLAKIIDAKTGDTIYIKHNDEKILVPVTGICENYLQHFLYMSPSLYKKLYEANPSYNIINVKLKTSDASAQQNISKNIVL
jgi:putative ABC transport system permease protein